MRTTVFHKTKHLDEHDLLPLENTCPFCASSDRKQIALVQTGPNVSLLQCERCFAVSASRFPSSNALSEYYETYYDGRNEQVTVDNPARIALHIFQYIKPRLSPELIHQPVFHIVDFGGGDGSISIQLAQKLLDFGIKKVNIMLVDYVTHHAKIENENISITRVESLDDMKSRNISIVIASAVLEHIPTPISSLRKLLEVIRSEGFFYARTPYVMPLIRMSRTLGLHFDFTFPAHLHDLGSDFWNQKNLYADNRWF